MTTAMRILGLAAAQILLASTAAAQVKFPSADEILAGIVRPEPPDPDALAYMARLITETPNSSSADSLVGGAVRALESSPGNTVVASRVLLLLVQFAEYGNENALRIFLRFGETLDASGRAIAVRVADHLRGEPEIMAFWGRAARVTSAVVANDAVEMLATSGTQGLAELRSLIAGDQIQNLGARERAKLFVRWGGIVPPAPSSLIRQQM